MIETLDQMLSAPQRKILGEVRDASPFPLYLVGGPVRDLLLGRNILDLDMAVEGNIDEICRHLSAKFGGTVCRHPRFCTAKMEFPNRVSVDLAETRKEAYPEPARLPVVHPGASIEEDLARRDFAIQAMALRLNGPAAGLLIDPFNGRADLKTRTIRILHPASFRDDPVRAFRAFRYAARYRFRLDADTRNALKGLLGHPDFLRAAGDRIFDEWRKTFEEDTWIETLRMMVGHGLPAWLGIRSAFHPRVLRCADPGMKKLRAFYPNLILWVVRWNAFFSLYPARIGRAAVLQTPFPKQIKKICMPPSDPGQILKFLNVASCVKPSQIYGRLSCMPPEWIAAIYGRSAARGRRRILKFVTTWRNVPPPVTGDLLRQWGVSPGPAYPKILKKLHAAAIDGILRSTEDARRIVSRLHPMK